MRYFLLTGLAIFLSFNSKEALAFDKGIYEKAEITSYVRPDYPRRQLENARSGSVELEVIINSEGRVENPEVVWSTHRDFERKAILAAINYKATPAMHNGKAVSSRRRIHVLFMISGQTNKITGNLAKLFKKGLVALDSDESSQSDIQEIIDKMSLTFHLSPLGLSYISFLEYRSAVKFGTTEEKQLSALKFLKIIHRLQVDKAFGKAELSLVWSGWIESLIKLGMYSEAVEEFNQFEEKELGKTETLQPYIQKVNILLKSGKPYKQPITLDKRGNTFSILSGNEIYIEDIDGEIENLHFRCQAKYKKLKFNQENNYRVPQSWGECRLQIEGAPKTEAKLIQMGKGNKFEEVSASSQKKD